jgi:hypothetical protein
MPPPPRAGGYPVINIRNTTSPHWRGWLKPESHCLIPANSFAEYAPELNPETKKKDDVWFALNNDRPLFAFAGIWIKFKGDRGTKSKPIAGPHHVYGFLATAPNGIVEPKSMTFGCGRRGTRPRHCKGPCLMRCGSLRAEPTRALTSLGINEAETVFIKILSEA